MLLDPGDRVVQHLVDDGGGFGHDLRAEDVAQRAAFDLEQFVEEALQSLVEGFPELGLGEHAGEVFLGEEAVADRVTDGAGEPCLVLGDRALEQPYTPAPERRGAVRVEEHPDGHRVGEPAGQRTGDDRHDGAQQCVVHEPCPVIAEGGAGSPSRRCDRCRW